MFVFPVFTVNTRLLCVHVLRIEPIHAKQVLYYWTIPPAPWCDISYPRFVGQYFLRIHPQSISPADTSWVSYNSNQFWHYLQGDRSQSLQPLSPARLVLFPVPVTSPGLWPVLLTNRLEIGGPTTNPLLGSINLLEQLTEVKETLDIYWLIFYRGYNDTGGARCRDV